MTTKMAKIYDYYELIEDRTYECKLCHKNIKSRSTSNLLNHFRNFHPDAFLENQSISSRVELRCSFDTPPKKIKRLIEEEHVDENGEVITEFEWENPEYEADVPERSTMTVETSEVGLPIEDPLKLFFLSMYGIAKTLPREEIYALRRRIFDLVSDAEEQQLYKRSGSVIARVHKEETVE